jgi:hypothetical protein
MNALARLAATLSAFACLALAGCGKTVYTETPPPKKDAAADKKAPEAKASEGKTPAAPKPQATCPVMGRPILKDVFLDHEGKRIYFCCPPCKEEFLKDPAKYMKKLADSGQVAEDTPK